MTKIYYEADGDLTALSGEGSPRPMARGSVWWLATGAGAEYT